MFIGIDVKARKVVCENGYKRKKRKSQVVFGLEEKVLKVAEQRYVVKYLPENNKQDPHNHRRQKIGENVSENLLVISHSCLLAYYRESASGPNFQDRGQCGYRLCVSVVLHRENAVGGYV